MPDKTITGMKIDETRPGCCSLVGICPEDNSAITVRVYRAGSSCNSYYDASCGLVVLHCGTPSAYDLIPQWIEMNATTHHFTFEGAPVLKYTRSRVNGESEPLKNAAIDFSGLADLNVLSSRRFDNAAASLLHLANAADKMNETSLPNLLSEIQQTRSLVEGAMLSAARKRPSFWRCLICPRN